MAHIVCSVYHLSSAFLTSIDFLFLAFPELPNVVHNILCRCWKVFTISIKYFFLSSIIEIWVSIIVTGNNTLTDVCFMNVRMELCLQFYNISTPFLCQWLKWSEGWVTVDNSCPSQYAKYIQLMAAHFFNGKKILNIFFSLSSHLSTACEVLTAVHSKSHDDTFSEIMCCRWCSCMLCNFTCNFWVLVKMLANVKPWEEHKSFHYPPCLWIFGSLYFAINMFWRPKFCLEIFETMLLIIHSYNDSISFLIITLISDRLS